MKTTVTGGTGFIGSHLVKRLLDEGKEVVVASDFRHLGTENLNDLGINNADIELRKLDLTDYGQALKAVEGADTVYHLAARVGSLEYLHSGEMAELIALQNNITIDAGVLRACIEKKVKKLIYASSVAVYSMETQFAPGALFSESDLDLRLLTQGTQSPHVMRELKSRPAVLPDGGYGWSKLLGEVQISWMKGIQVGVARIINIYGPNEPLGKHAHVIADLIKRAIRYPEEQFVVYGDGSQSRDFLFVSDCARALVKLEKKLSGKSESIVTVNIGSGKPTSIRELAEKTAALANKGIKPVYMPEKPAGPVSRTAVIDRAEKLLEWRPEISFDEGLCRTYQWAETKLATRSPDAK
jgi:GDP-D-mannose 3', 5'-epimerase